MSTQRNLSHTDLVGGRAPTQQSRAEATFRTLNRRATMLANSDDTAVATSLSVSASAMIADALCRLSSIEPEECTTQPASTPDGAPMLRLVGGIDD